ncbi:MULTISPECIES: hydrolase 1, exosortase A system-associated [Novosphingobium]|uniref:hydrolase 1, exosortase A system-associated n=1 Tax=Novosphingobium TaxID=165696 RepID=UPI001CD4D23D|nr:hydrolase 1, exosortase A system-associated [Novosphingobium percolationis]MCH7629958.1 hydrolase 1, exosortase A system-associated [Pseudomonadota bacterium]
MMRRHLSFTCEGALLAGTLDTSAAAGPTGVLFVSGGNEIRSGAFGGMAQLSARLAREEGVPCLRFDRRGVGQSEGDNEGFRSSAADIAAAIAAFRHDAPHLKRVIGFGVCDAASALALHGAALGLDGLVLVNPWTRDEADGRAPAVPPKALWRRYAARLASGREWKRLLTGGVDLRGVARDVQGAALTPGQTRLAREMQMSLGKFAGPVTILLAEGDRTAQLFEAAWKRKDARVRRHASAGHAFDGDEARDWLVARLVEAVG